MVALVVGVVDGVLVAEVVWLDVGDVVWLDVTVLVGVLVVVVLVSDVVVLDTDVVVLETVVDVWLVVVDETVVLETLVVVLEIVVLVPVVVVLDTVVVVLDTVVDVWLVVVDETVVLETLVVVLEIVVLETDVVVLVVSVVVVVGVVVGVVVVGVVDCVVVADVVWVEVNVVVGLVVGVDSSQTASPRPWPVSIRLCNSTDASQSTFSFTKPPNEHLRMPSAFNVKVLMTTVFQNASAEPQSSSELTVSMSSSLAWHEKMSPPPVYPQVAAASLSRAACAKHDSPASTATYVCPPTFLHTKRPRSAVVVGVVVADVVWVVVVVGVVVTVVVGVVKWQVSKDKSTYESNAAFNTRASFSHSASDEVEKKPSREHVE